MPLFGRACVFNPNPNLISCWLHSETATVLLFPLMSPWLECLKLYEESSTNAVIQVYPSVPDGCPFVNYELRGWQGFDITRHSDGTWNSTLVHAIVDDWKFEVEIPWDTERQAQQQRPWQKLDCRKAPQPSGMNRELLCCCHLFVA